MYKPAPEDLHLGMHDDPDGGAALLHLGQLLGAGLSESILLGLGPVVDNTGTD